MFGPLLIGILALGLWIDFRGAESGRFPWGGIGMIWLFTIPALFELARILPQAGLPVRGPLVPTASAIALAAHGPLVGAGWAAGEAWWLLLSMGLLTILCGNELCDRDVDSGARRVAGVLLCFGTALSLGALSMVTARYGTKVLFALVISTKSVDMGAYIGGRFLGGRVFGDRKLIPHVSPNKTIEGAVGGTLGCLAVSAWLIPWLGDGRWGVVPALAIGLGLTGSTQVGDLVESLWKRSAGVKDSGRLVPEFGGSLDMVDSFLLSAPVGYALLTALESTTASG